MSRTQQRRTRQLAAQQRKDDRYWRAFEKQNAGLKELQATYYEACGMEPCTAEHYADWLSRYITDGYSDIRFVPAVDWTQFSVVTKAPSFNLPPLHDERVRHLLIPQGIEVNAVQKEPCGARGYTYHEDWGEATAFGYLHDNIYVLGQTDVICSPEVIRELDLTTGGWDQLELSLQEHWKAEVRRYHEKLAGPPYEVPQHLHQDSDAINASIAAWRQHADDVTTFMRNLDAFTTQCHDTIQETKP